MNDRIFTLPDTGKLIGKELRRFEAKYRIDSDTGCWLWISTVGRGGYGQFWLRGKTLAAHRVSYSHHIGPIPDGYTIDHIEAACSSRSCVSPGHLRAISNKANILAGSGAAAINARKTECKHGHPFDEENTYLRLSGGRLCKECGRLRRRARRSSGVAR